MLRTCSKAALATLDMSTFVTGVVGVRFGADAYNQLGSALGGVGDVNGDGFDDIALGAKHANLPDSESAGVVCVIFGNANIYASDVDLRNYAASLLGFAIYGSSPLANLHLVAPAGDINGDGVHIVHGQVAPRATNVDTLTDKAVTFYAPPGHSSFLPWMEGRISTVMESRTFFWEVLRAPPVPIVAVCGCFLARSVLLMYSYLRSSALQHMLLFIMPHEPPCRMDTLWK